MSMKGPWTGLRMWHKEQPTGPLQINNIVHIHSHSVTGLLRSTNVDGRPNAINKISQFQCWFTDVWVECGCSPSVGSFWFVLFLLFVLYLGFWGVFCLERRVTQWKDCWTIQSDWPAKYMPVLTAMRKSLSDNKWNLDKLLRMGYSVCLPSKLKVAVRMLSCFIVEILRETHTMKIRVHSNHTKQSIIGNSVPPTATETFPPSVLKQGQQCRLCGANSTANTPFVPLCTTRPILTIQISYQRLLSQQLSVFSVVISVGLIDL